MPRRVDPDLLVGAYDIAERLGLRHSQHIHYFLRHDESFPRPVATLGGPKLKTQVWYWPDVERWARTNGRLPGKSTKGDRATGP